MIDKSDIDRIITSGIIHWQKHALQRLMERNISRFRVKQAILSGRIIESYEDDRPYPSFLIADIGEEKSLHAVVAVNAEDEICYIITAYIPDENYFEEDLVTRRI
jgi:hypothetical protein